MTSRLRRSGPFLAFAGLCYIPLLLTSPGYVVADTKSYLYLDPARLLARAWSMWDPHVGLGTVTHQNIGFLWPMGPYYWLLEQLGAPDWVAQRLWLGSIMFLAGLGVWYLSRTLGWRGPAVAATVCAYALTPYLLTIAVRISAILLPYVALPWLIALIVRATRTGGWRHPAAFALVVATVGTSNATSILLVGVGPALWLLWALGTGRHPAGRLAGAGARTLLLTLATNLWWIAGLSVQASHGVEVLRYTESVEVTAAASAAQEVLRGLGYWFFYGDDALGPWVGPSRPFQADPILIALTFAVPVLALLAGSVTRWRERSFAVLLLVVGLALAVGVHPYGDPPPFGRALKAFLHSDVGMAMRSMPRAAPLVVLALVLLLGAGLLALARRVPWTTWPAAGAVVGLVVLALPPLWQRTLVPENLRREEDIPTYWVEAGRLLDARDDGTRVLEVPGADFTSYRWGTTVDPVTPGLMDRPMVARELIPQGGAAGWNLLKALDGRFQRHVAEPDAIAPIARLLRAGDLLVRSDVAFEHYDTPRPRSFWQVVTSAPGLARPLAVGPATPNEAIPRTPMLDELALATDPAQPDPPAVAILPVEDAVPIVSTKAPGRPVVVAGEGEGLVDLAAAGLIEEHEVALYSAALSEAELDAALADDAVLVVTDTNRRRAERWGTIRFTDGYTEPAGLEPLRLDRSDARLPVFPDAGDDARTVAIHAGGISANATSYGGRNEYLPEDRPAHAVDGDPATSWRASRDDPVVGERLRITTDDPVTPRTLTFLAPPPPINRWITRVELRFDGLDPLFVELDETSRSAPGQVIDIGDRTFSTLDVEVLADSAGPQSRYGGLTSTGFAEVTLGEGRLVLDERIRPPVDLLRRAGGDAADLPLVVVLTRLRSAPTDVERLDEEPQLVRQLELPAPRRFLLSGTARLSARASDTVLGDILSPSEPIRASSSSRLPTVRHRGAAAFDGDRGTAWVAAYGSQVGQWLEVTAPEPVTVGHIDLDVIADAQHSIPTRVGVLLDGTQVALLDVPAIERGPAGTTRSVRLPLPDEVSGRTIRLVVEEVDERTTVDRAPRTIRTLPVGIAEAGVAEVRIDPSGDRFTTGCRTDLLEIDGESVPVEASAGWVQAEAGGELELRACGGGSLELGGTPVLRTTPGEATGIDIDRVVLRSDPVGGPGEAPAGPLSPSSPAPATVTVERQGPDEITARVSGADPGEDLWFILGQSHSSGWVATVDGTELGSGRLVDGFANGWRITPEATTFDVELRFEPQRRVDVALWISALAALLCLLLVARRPAVRSTSPATSGRLPTIALDRGAAALSWSLTIAAAAVAGLLGLVLAGPGVGIATTAVALVSARGPGIGATALAAPLAMGISAGYVVVAVARRHPLPGLEWTTELTRAHPIAWFAVLALAIEAAISALRGRTRR